MILPKVPDISLQKTVINVFGGLNLTNMASDGESVKQYGMSTEEYPYLSPSRTSPYESEMYDVFQRFIWEGHSVTLREEHGGAGDTALFIDSELAKSNVKYFQAAVVMRWLVVFAYSADGTVSYKRKMHWEDGVKSEEDLTNAPDMEFICSFNNRLAGVSNQIDGNARTIYISGLGDPNNWTYSTVQASINAWYSSVASDYPFTGIAAFNGQLYVFKERSVIRVLGSDASDWYVSETSMPGVKRGFYNTIAISEGRMYYVGPDGVYTYSNSAGIGKISEALGVSLFDSAWFSSPDRQSAAAISGKYVLCMNGANGGSIYVFDTERGLWSVENEAIFEPRCVCRGWYNTVEVYGSINVSQRHGFYSYSIYSVNGGAYGAWESYLAPVKSHEGTHRNFIRFVAEAKLGALSTLKILVREDGGSWRVAKEVHPNKRTSMSIPVRINRCEEFQIGFSGEGFSEIRAVSLIYTNGSEA